MPTQMNSKRMLGLKLAILSRQMRQEFDQRAELIGVTRAQWQMIAVVSAKPGATQREVATALEISDVSAGRLVDRLCADGYIERRPHPSDRRAHCLYLTDSSSPVLEKLATVAESYEADMFTGVSEQDLKSFIKLMDALSSNIAQLRKNTTAKQPQV